MGVSPAFLLNATDGVGQGAGGRGAVGTGGQDKRMKKCTSFWRRWNTHGGTAVWSAGRSAVG